MTGIFAHWTDSNAQFSTAQINIRNPSTNNFYTEGEFYERKTKGYTVEKHHPTGSYFWRDSHRMSLGKDVAYILAFPIHKVLTTLGNGGLAFLDVGIACKTAFYERTATFSDAAKPALARLKSFGKADAILAILALLRHRQTTFLSLNVYNSICWMATAGAIGAIAYACHNPKGTKAYIGKFEAAINGKKPLDYYQVGRLDPRAKWIARLDGSYSLSRILQMYLIGTTADKCYDGTTDRFDTVEPEKKSN
ncbi:MAG: hypothetical protein KR126chlam3_00522 [Chlamydiae bacterium]|nr:hypothetical protein [Chlamydiota bacterium]